MAKCVFSIASAVKKWPNFSKLAMKWPIWQPWLELFCLQTNTLVEDKITQTVLLFREAK